MSERNEVTSEPEAEPALPAAAPESTATGRLAAVVHTFPPVNRDEEEVKTRIAALEREARAIGSSPEAAALFYEIGLLWEDPLRNPRNAAVAYQNAFRLAPRLLPNVRTARRLFADVGNWQMVVQLLDAEREAQGRPQSAAALLLEKAAVLEERLSRHEEATAAYRGCLDLRPTDVAVLTQLEGVFAAREEFEPLVQVRRLLAEQLEEPGLKAHYLCTSGFVLEERLEQPEEAAACFRAAFALDRKDLLLLSAVKRIAEREGKTDELLDALAAEAELLGAHAAPAYLQIGKLYERLGRNEDALSALLAARRGREDEPLVLAELARIYEAQGRHEDLADVLLSWAGAITDESEIIAVNLRLAALHEEVLKRDADAMARYRAILERVPGHGSALAGLGKLCHRMGDWEGLLAVFDSEIAAAEDPRLKAARMFKAAEVLDLRLGRTEEAIGRYAQCLQLQPGYLPAQQALTRTYERQGRWADLVAVHELDLQQASDKEQQISTLGKMAQLYEERLGDLERAAECLRRISELSTDPLPALRALARLHERAGQWRQLIDCQEQEAGRVGDTRQVLSLHHRNAEILEEHLQDRGGAITAYERLIALSPSYLPALKALGRLYAQDRRWDDLIRMYRAESEISSSTEQAAQLIYKIGELFEHKLQNENEAIASYQEVLTLAPSYFPALRALARTYRAQQAWESLVEVLRAEAANRTDPVERANALFQAAAIWEDHLAREEMAITGYQEVLRLTPGHASAIRALQRLHAGQGDLKELVTVLDREASSAATPNARAGAYLQLARLYLDRLQEPSRAAQCCDSVLNLEPGNLPALKMLERVRAQDRARRADVRLRLADRVSHVRLKNAFRLAAARDREAAGAEPMVEELVRALQAEPSDPRLAFAVERVLRQAQDFQGLLTHYEQRLTHAEDPADQLDLHLRIGKLCERNLVDLPRAKDAFLAATELSATSIPALQGARRTLLAMGEKLKAREFLEAEGALCRDPQGAIDAFVAAGELCESLGDEDGAIADYQRALERDPLTTRVGERLERILSRRGGAEELAQLHEHRAEAKVLQKEPAAAATGFIAAARVWSGANQTSRALAAVERALEAQANHPAALELKSELSLSDGQYAQAASALASRVQQGGEAAEISVLHRRLGALYQDYLEDPSRAAAHLQTALSGDPTDLEALERLARIHTTSRNWTGAADCRKRLMEVETAPEALATHAIGLAEVLEEGFADPTQATALYRKALELSPSRFELVERLVRLYEQAGNVPELVGFLEQQAALADDDGAQGRSVELRLRIGALRARTLNDVEGAQATYRLVAEQAPSTLEAHLALGELYMRDAASAPLAIEAHRQVLRLDPTRADSLRALYRLWDGQGQVDRAFCALGLLQFLRACDDAETELHGELRTRIPQEKAEALPEAALTALVPEAAQSAVVEVLRAIGDQLGKVYPPRFESLGVDRKADRIKADHVVFRAVRGVLQLFGVTEFEVFLARRGLVTLEVSEPLAVCVGQDVVRKFNAREQKFLLGRAAMGLLNKTAVLARLSTGEAGDLLGAAIRIHAPAFDGLGRRNEELTKQVRRACSRKALRALEGPANALVGESGIDLAPITASLEETGQRAGLLVCGDVAAGLSLLAREEAPQTTVRPDGSEPTAQLLAQRADLRALAVFALSEEFFQLRRRLGVALPDRS